jgi:hypothetical protein
MAQNIKLVVYPVKNLKVAEELFSKFLGVEPYADSPSYVGYKLENLEVGLDPNGKGIVAYVDVTDVKKRLQTLLESVWRGYSARRQRCSWRLANCPSKKMLTATS